MAELPKLSFFQSVLSGNRGTGSTARVCTLLVFVFALLWVSFLVGIHRALPDLGGLTIFITSVTSCVYGVNKVAGAFSSKKDDSNGNGGGNG